MTRDNWDDEGSLRMTRDKCDVKVDWDDWNA